MAVQPQTPYKEYTANGSTKSFALGFDCDNQDHLIVLVDDIEPVVGTWSLIGGAVVFGTAPINGKKITIQRNTPFRRDGDFQSYDNSFRPASVNKGFDKIWWKIQELGVADWILSNRIDALKAYVDQQDGTLQENIDNLKNYVDDKDDELRNYLLNAIQEQGVALDQLEEYYSYLMQQLAQVAIDRGWAASFIVSADGSTQQEINDRIGNTWYAKPLGYELNARVMLENGDTVKSTAPNNTNDPNLNMTGWVHDQPFKTLYDFGAVGDGVYHPLSERFISLTLAKLVYPFATSLTNSIDWAALQAGVNYCAGGVATLTIPDGTYVLHAPRQGSQITMVNIASGLTIRGNGYGSCLKIADGYSSGGDYRVMASANGDTVDDFKISGVRFDGNGTNNLVLDSGVNVRRAYSIHILAGKNPAVMDCFFENNPGRNVIVLGNNTNPPSISNAIVAFNSFNNMGGAIVGNNKQNDHSSIYCQSQLGLVAFNHFNNDAAFNPLSVPAFACVALEIHGNRTDVIGNIVNNYGTGGNLVASVHDSYDNRWINNKFLNMVSNVLTLWTTNNFRNQRLTVRGNLITINNTVFAGGSAIFQNTTTAITSRQIEDLVIEDNIICYLSEVRKSDTTTGLQLTAVKGGTVRRNKFYNVQGAGISLAEAISALDIYDLDISDNEFDNCGIHTALSRLWGIYIVNTDINKLFSNIRINRNKFMKRLPTNVGDTPNPSRGIRIVGGGLLQDIVIGADNIFNNIDRAQRIEFVTTTNNKNVIAQKLTITAPRATLPTRGLFDTGRELVQYSDAIAGGAIGRIVTVGGAASEATWAAGTAYTRGQWIKTSTGKVLVCLSAGTSDVTEPAPTTLGITLTDGTVTWVYRDAKSATFAEYGASYLTGTAAYTPAAIAASAKFTVSVSVPAASVGDVAMASYSAPLQGLSISCSVDSANVVNVTFANNTGGAVTLAAGTIYVRAFKQ